MDENLVPRVNFRQKYINNTIIYNPWIVIFTIKSKH